MYAVIGYAFTARRRLLLAIALTVAGLHVWLAWPDVRPPARLSAEVKGAPQLKVFSSNLFFLNRDIEPIMDELAATDADVAIFVEAIEPHRDALNRDWMLARYPFRVESPINEGANVILSRLPITSSSFVDIGSRSSALAVLSTAIGPVSIVAIHTFSPTSDRNVGRWSEQLGDLARFVEAAEGPLVLAGDFNATVYHRRFRTLLGLGLTDAQSARGMGLRATYPAHRWYPPLLRIDHVLSTRQLVPVDFAIGNGSGSDHHPIVATLALVGDR